MNIAKYFVDESGDLTLFNRKKQMIVGTKGVSRFFIIGAALIEGLEELGNELAGLRDSILADPFFAGVPSIHDPKYQKTAAFFHAKNDLPEVRRDVFKILARSDIKFRAIVRNKEVLARNAAEKFAATGQKTSEDAIYDDMVKRLFRDSLHKHDQNEIIFAWRGSKDRKESLEKAIKKAKHNFNARWNKNHDVPTDVVSGFPKDHVGLQVVDYYLWALQRLYEQRDGRFFNYLSKQFRLVIDMDDTRKHGYGEFYSDQNPLSLEKIMPSVD